MEDKDKLLNSPTLAEVARAAGVSTATVSRVLNNSVNAEEVNAKVRTAIEQLGYQQQRKHQKRKAQAYLAVLTEDITIPFFAQVIAGIQEQASLQDCLMLVNITGSRSSEKLWVFSQLKKQPLKGLIAAGTYMKPEDWIGLYNEIKVPLVVMNTPINHPKIASVMVNFESATEQAVQHLLHLGHIRIAYLGDNENPFSTQELRGIGTALAKAGLPHPDDTHISIPHTQEGAYQGISRIMMIPPEERPTALLAFDDELAMHLLNALRYYGMRVPEDISIVGFDNIPMAAHTHPTLTTIDVPKRRIGRQMVTLLHRLATNENGTVGQIILDGSLLVRGSTGPVPLRPRSVSI